LLHGRNQERRQQTDNRDRHHQFKQRKATTLSTGLLGTMTSILYGDSE
jgi:hypothetical protein